MFATARVKRKQRFWIAAADHHAKPAAYLVNKIYMRGLPSCDERTIVPRSFIGEFLSPISAARATTTTVR
jgi:hypothetical protein